MQAIADRVGYRSKGACYVAMMRALDRTTALAADEMRDFTINRLDQLLTSVWPYALGIHPSQMQNGRPGKPDMVAVDKVLSIEAQRARILGLNAPEKIDVRALIAELAAPEGLTDDEQRDAVEFVERHLKASRAGT